MIFFIGIVCLLLHRYLAGIFTDAYLADMLFGKTPKIVFIVQWPLFFGGWGCVLYVAYQLCVRWLP